MRKFNVHMLSLGFVACAALALSACTTTGGTDVGGVSAAVTEAGLSVFIALAEQRLDTDAPSAASAKKQLTTLDTEYAAVTVGRIAFDAAQAARGIPLDPSLAQSRTTVDDGYWRLRAKLVVLAAPG